MYLKVTLDIGYGWQYHPPCYGMHLHSTRILYMANFYAN